MNDDDIHAFGPPPAVVGVVHRRRRLWPWLLGGLLVLALLAAGALAALLTLADSAHHGMHVIVNGQPWDGWDAWEGWDGMDWDVGPGHGLLAGLGVLVAVFVVLLVVPCTLLLGLSLALMGVAIGLAVTLGTVGLLAAVLLSPLWGLGLLLWLLFRRRGPPAAPSTARMAA
jgi:hypothetical protein